MTKHLRKGAFILQKPKKPNAPLGTCKWCGNKLTGKNAAKRNYCYPDREKRNCKWDSYHSWVWDTKEVVRRLAVMNGQKELFCANCKQPCEILTKTGKRKGKILKRWEADHKKPLFEGGKHVKGNLQCLCVPCHRIKTAKEAAKRAKRPRNKR